MMAAPLSRLAVVAGALLMAAAGCSSGKPARVPVHGKVSFRGAALRCGTVVFTPDVSRGHEGSLARGDIGPDGSYSLRTDTGYGALPGWYRVTVLAVEMPARPAGQAYPVPRSLLPEKYRDPDQAGLVREIKANGDNHIDLNLD
jgi:hypothetical protein